VNKDEVLWTFDGEQHTDKRVEFGKLSA